jgi:nicotinamide riboside transporter PnuC
MNTFQKYPKDWMKVILAVMVGFFAVMGVHFSEAANKPFWWKFWIVIAVVCIIGWVGGWVFLSSKDKNK